MSNTDTEPKSVADIFEGIREQPEEGAHRFETSVDLSSVDLKDSREESRLLREQGHEHGIHIPDKPPKSDVPLNNPELAVDPTRSVREEVEASFKAEFDFGKVEVTQEERERFLRCALHDTEMWFEVELEGIELRVTVALPTEHYTTSVLTALDKWNAAGAIDVRSDMQWLLGFQQLHAWYMIRSINGNPTSWSEDFHDDKPLRGKALREFIYDPENLTEIIEMGAVRWRSLVVAMRVAEAKYKLCTDALRDRSFFTGAGTA